MGGQSLYHLPGYSQVHCVALRLLLPFGPEVSLMGKAYQAVDQVISQATPLPLHRKIFRATFIVARFLSPAAFSVLHIPRLPASYIKEERNMVQQLSDAELEIMKIVWGNPEEVTRAFEGKKSIVTGRASSFSAWFIRETCSLAHALASVTP
mgnify:CR=1 FL=1